MMRVLAVFLIVAAVAGCGKDEGTSGSGGSGSGSGASSSVNPSGLDGTKDLSADLKKMVEGAYAAAKAGEKAKLAEYVKTFPIPGHEAFFQKVFGPKISLERIPDYKAMLEGFDEKVSSLFEKIAKDGFGTIDVVCLTKADDPEAKGNQKETMASMLAPVPIYTVYFRPKPGEPGQSVYNWVYVDGGFRLMGK